jgi:uncharacterized OB-fold protein
MDPYAAQFWEFTKDKELRLQKCSTCGKYRWPPSAICDGCLSEEYEWTELSGAGRVISWTTFHRAYFPEYPAPHTNIVLELDEGPLFVAFPVGIDASELKEGMRLELRWEDAEDRFGEYNLPVFGPSG